MAQKKTPAKTVRTARLGNSAPAPIDASSTPPAEDTHDVFAADPATPTPPSAARTKTTTPVAEQHAETPNVLRRRGWMIPDSDFDRLVRVKGEYLLADAARYARRRHLSDQAFVRALLDVALDLLEHDLAIGSNHGLAGELETHILDRSR